MPEGPEVKRTVDYLQQFKNKIITKISFNSGRYITHGPFKNYKKLEDSLPLKIINIKCKGKFIYFLLENNMVIFNTLGMTGYWTKQELKHNNITFYFKNEKLYFNDMRNFGTLMYQSQNQLEKKLDELGPDILEDYKNFILFNERLERKRNDTTIGAALLDQKVASGCGNYLRAEALYQSLINPHKIIKKIDIKKREELWENLTKIAWIFYDYKKGIKKGILNKSDKLVKLYVSKDYNKSTYYHNFIVYFQDTDNKGNKVITEKLGTRTIHYVPKLQK